MFGQSRMSYFRYVADKSASWDMEKISFRLNNPSSTITNWKSLSFYAKNMEETKEKYAEGEAQAREAFDELCGMYEAWEVCRL